MDKTFKVIIVEDVKLELKGTEEIFRNDIPQAEIIGTASNENEFWKLMSEDTPDMILLDLGLGGSTTVGVDICRKVRAKDKDVRVLIFTGEVLNEKLWVDVLDAGADGIILKSGELLTEWESALFIAFPVSSWAYICSPFSIFLVSSCTRTERAESQSTSTKESSIANSPVTLTPL